MSISRDDDWPDLPPASKPAAVERAELERAGARDSPALDRGAVRAGLRRHRRRRPARGLSCADFKQAGGEVRLRVARWLARSFDGGALVGRARGRLATWRARSSSMPPAPGPIASPKRAASRPLGIAPKRRTMVQLRVGHAGLKELAAGRRRRRHLLFQGRGRPVAFGSARMTRSRPIPATPRPRRSTSPRRSTVSKRWSTGRSSASSGAGRASGRFAPDRLPVYGFDSDVRGLLLVRRAGRVRHPDLARGGEARRRAAAWRSARPDGRAHRPAVFSPRRFG